MKYVRSNLDEESEAGASTSSIGGSGIGGIGPANEAFQNVPTVSVPRSRSSRFNRIRGYLRQRNYLEKFLFMAVCILALVVLALSTFLYNVHCSPAWHHLPYQVQYRKVVLPGTVEPGQNLSNVCMHPVCISLSARILSYMNEQAKPCEDFYEFACGSFRKRVAIPPGMQQVTSFSLQSETNEILLRSILESPLASSSGFVSELHDNAARLYASCMNDSARERDGLGPVLQHLADLAPWSAHRVSAKAFNASEWNLMDSVNRVTLFLLSYSDSVPFYAVDVQPDNFNSTRYVLNVGQAKTMLPVRENYIGNGSSTNLAALADALQSISRLFNFSLDQAAVAKLIELEKQLAQILLPESDRRDSTKTLNSNVKYLIDNVACVSWQDVLNKFIRNLSYPISPGTPVNIRDEKFLKQLCSLLEKYSSDPVKKETMNNYLLIRSVWPFLGILNKEAAKIPRVLNQVTEGVHGSLNPWTLCVRSVSGIFGFALGKLYVDRHFDDRSRLEVNTMINDVKSAFNLSLSESAWMDENTRRLAMDKLASISNLVGYPDYFANETAMRLEWGDFRFNASDYFGNLEQIQRVNYVKSVGKLTEPVKLEFGMTPQSINAYYSPSSNVIAFPAGILQRPFYQAEFPPYISYGAIGAVIGHEVTHGFDDDGRNFDKDGNQRQWWSNATAEKFTTAANCIVKQYENFVVDGDVRVPGRLVLGESIADNGGLKTAYRAYKAKAGQLREPKLPYLSEKYNNEQLLFVAYSQTWCELETSQSLRQTVKMDPHPPGKMRVWGPITNSRDFGRVFKCQPGEPMNPVDKCTVW